MPFLSNIGTTEIIVIGIVLLVLFGGKKLQEWARGIGEAGRELKKAKKEFQNSYEEVDGQKPIIEEKKSEKKPIKNNKEEVG